MLYDNWEEVELKPLDFFASSNPTSAKLGKVINWIQAWNAPDRKSRYTHAGLIVDKTGTIFEAGVKRKGETGLHKNLLRNLFEEYSGSDVIVCRSGLVTDEMVGKYLFPVIQEYNEEVYSYWRLVFFMYPPIARRLGVKKFGVCSELVSMPYARAEILDYWMGKSPDNLVDMVRACDGCPAPEERQKWQIVIEKRMP